MVQIFPPVISIYKKKKEKKKKKKKGIAMSCIQIHEVSLRGSFKFY